MTVDALLKIVENAYGKKFYEEPLGMAIDQAVRVSHAATVTYSDNAQIVHAIQAIKHMVAELNRMSSRLQYEMKPCSNPSETNPSHRGNINGI